MSKKFISTLCAIGMLLTTTSTSYADVKPTIQESNQSEIQVSYDEKENLELQEDFERIFSKEMNEIENIVNINKFSRKSHENYLKEISGMTPIIDSEKSEGDNHYRLVAYSNGLFYQLALKDGSYSSGTGYTSWSNRKAYAQLGSPAVNAVTGHTFTSTISYTHVNGGNDYISSASPYSFYYCQNAYTQSKNFNETSYSKAYVTFYYDGRTAYMNGVGNVYSPFRFTINVGNDTVSLSANLR